MGLSFSNLHMSAWGKLGIGTRERPAEIFPSFTRKEFEELKNDYVQQHGYTIRIPQLDDIIHLKPDLMKTKEEIKREKKEGLTRILDSPAPEWFRYFSTVMTFIDDVQDTASIIFPMVRMIYRMAPKVMGKFLNAAGWLLLPFDILQLLNALGRGPFAHMGAKREVCRFKKRNPFGKKAQVLRMTRINKWKPGLADLIQVAQTTEKYTGVGLSLGAMMGTITDSIFGAYRYLAGDPVRFTFDPPDTENLNRMGARALMAAAAISTQDQTFEELTHFWTYQTAAMGSMLIAGHFRDNMLIDLVDDPMNIALPAPEPTNPYTIAAIQEAGLNVQDGVGWPFNGEKIISLGDFIDATTEPAEQSFIRYCDRHSKDWYGWATGEAMGSLFPQVIMSVEPEADLIMDDTPQMKVLFRMVKAPILPEHPFTQDQARQFFEWVDAYSIHYEEGPGIIEIENKLTQLGIRYKTSYPAEEEPGFLDFWPEGYRGEESF